MSVRIEHDTFGEIEVPSDKYWGAQTERSKRNFPVGKEHMPIEVIYGFAQLKRGAALANHELGKLSDTKKDAIIYACDLILKGELDGHFPLVVWQTGSGTQSNMNVNEVVSYVANEYLKNIIAMNRFIPMMMLINLKVRMIHSLQLCMLLYTMKLKRN